MDDTDVPRCYFDAKPSDDDMDDVDDNDGSTDDGDDVGSSAPVVISSPPASP